MRCGEEGKLLARAADFYHPGRAERITGPTYSALNISFMQERDASALLAGSGNPFRSHQGEREKNEYSYDGETTGQLSKPKQIKL